MLVFELGYYTMFFLCIKFQEKKQKKQNSEHQNYCEDFVKISLIQANKIWIWFIRNKVVLEEDWICYMTPQ